MPTAKDRVDKHDRKIAAIEKLLPTGMKMQVRNDKQIRELQAAQKETDRQLHLLIKSLHPGDGNGHSKSSRVR